jgi:hypothetical protein
MAAVTPNASMSVCFSLLLLMTTVLVEICGSISGIDNIDFELIYQSKIDRFRISLLLKPLPPALNDRAAENTAVYFWGENAVGKSWIDRTTQIQCLELFWG